MRKGAHQKGLSELHFCFDLVYYSDRGGLYLGRATAERYSIERERFAAYVGSDRRL